jgi:RNA polymerase sigma factor (sigma-70 family)
LTPPNDGPGSVMPPGFPDDATLRELQRDLHRFFRRRLPAGRDPQDFVAEVLLALRNYRGQASIGTYAYSVARNLLAGMYRCSPRTSPLPTTEGPATSMPGASTLLRRREAVSMLRSEVEEINPLYGEVVRLRLKGLGPREIAEELGVSQHTIRSRLARGIAELRSRFAGRRATIELEL